MKRTVSISILALTLLALFLNRGKEQVASSPEENNALKGKDSAHSISLSRTRAKSKQSTSSQSSTAAQNNDQYIELDIEPAQQLGAAGNSPAEDIEHIMSLIFFYDHYLKEGTIPTGMNEDFVDALTGKNSQRVRLIKKSHPSIDKHGRFIDQWESPYFFHSISSKEFSVRSAGPDRELYTEDDIVRETNS